MPMSPRGALLAASRFVKYGEIVLLENAREVGNLVCHCWTSIGLVGEMLESCWSMDGGDQQSTSSDISLRVYSMLSLISTEKFHSHIQLSGTFCLVPRER